MTLEVHHFERSLLICCWAKLCDQSSCHLESYLVAVKRFDSNSAFTELFLRQSPLGFGIA
jgi:hypothetical protein